MDRFVAQAGLVGLVVQQGRVVEVRQGEAGLEVVLDQGRTLAAGAVMVATGTAPRALEAVADPRVVYRVDALARSLAGQRVLVVGGGEAALDQALLALRRGAARVTVAFRGARPRAMELLVRRCRERGVVLAPETRLEALEPADSTSGRAIAVTSCGGQRGELSVDAVVVCVGKDPALPRLPAAVGHPAEVDRLGRTEVAGLYLLGDACRGRLRQVSIAVGDGVAAAMHAASYLRTARQPWRD